MIGEAAANALRRGLWNRARNAPKFSVGWIDHSHNHVLAKLFSRALVSSSIGHETALKIIKEDIDLLKRRAKIS